MDDDYFDDDDNFDEEDDYGDDDWDNEDFEDHPIDGVGFADPGGHSSLRAETPSNPRNLPCPTCKEPDRLTPADVRNSYQCNECADKAEGRGGY